MTDKKADKVSVTQAVHQLAKSMSEAMDTVSSISRDDINTLLKAFKLMGEHIEKIEDVLKVYSALYNRLSSDVIPKTLEAHEFESVKLGGYLFTPTIKLRANIPNDLKPKGFEWLRTEGMEALIAEQVNANSLSSAIREYIERTGKTPPEDAIHLYHQIYTQVRAVK